MHSRSASRRVPIPVRLPGRRARSQTPPDAADPGSPADQVVATPQPQLIDAAWALTRAEADLLCGRVTIAATEPTARALADASPATITATARHWSLSPDAMRMGIEAMLGAGMDAGCVEVLRLPGALRSPEMWHVRLIGVEPAAAERVGAAVRRAQGRDESDVR